MELAFAIWPLNFSRYEYTRIPSELLKTSESVTVITIDIFWEILGILPGPFWDKPMKQRDNTNTVRLPVNRALMIILISMTTHKKVESIYLQDP